MKAYILRINSPVSLEYAKITADSCDKVGLKWEYFDGWYDITGRAAWCQTGIKMKFYEPPLTIDNMSPAQKANACSAGHGAIWKKIADGPDEIGIVLEHDAIMYYKPELYIFDNSIVVLGYKVTNPNDYDHVKAGPPRELFNLDGHEGAHAYMMTKKTAQLLVDEIEEHGILGAVDNAYFIRGQRRTKVPLAIMSPTPALGWLRESTIWNGSADRNYKFIPSFEKYYK
ncbi:MAG: hypothetical protein ACKVJK_08325 [Methylophagaceae bacterium]|jgi:hypothetical protein|tara:strand:+ start:1480 stop:2163 length:684 start_codon:yes stop_codon:yes gene_type:complete